MHAWEWAHGEAAATGQRALASLCHSGAAGTLFASLVPWAPATARRSIRRALITCYPSILNPGW